MRANSRTLLVTSIRLSCGRERRSEIKRPHRGPGARQMGTKLSEMGGGRSAANGDYVQLLRVTLDGGDVTACGAPTSRLRSEVLQGYRRDTEFPTQAVETLAQHRRGSQSGRC